MTATVFDWLWPALPWTWHDPDGYNIVSGPVADIALLGGAYAILRRHNCHAKGCLRLGRHRVAGTDYIVCRTHHPPDMPTARADPRRASRGQAVSAGHLGSPHQRDRDRPDAN